MKFNMFELIKQLCDNNMITIAELERRADLGNGTIRRWKDSYPSVDKVARVANVLNTSIEYLYTGSEVEVPNAVARKIEHLNEAEITAVNTLIDAFLSKKNKE